MAMFSVARLQAESVAKALDLGGVGRLLDLGGGPGTYAAYFCARNPGLRAVVFDRPAAAKYAEKVLRGMDLLGRVDFVGGDILSDRLPGGFGAVWISQVIHCEGPEGAARMIGKAASSLERGGLLAVHEFYLDDGRAGPLMPALFSLNMLLQIGGGQAYTWGEVRAMMEGAGLAGVRKLEAPLPPGSGILLGRKI
jgi:SAM-dependent methyltransferase